ncbi:hypothetical protein U1Q18_028243 [Sarracenia purpurea var. burkii]
MSPPISADTYPEGRDEMQGKWGDFSFSILPLFDLQNREEFGSNSSSGAAVHHHPRRQLSSPTTVHHHAITTRPPPLSEPTPLRLISPAYSSSPITASLVDHLHFRLSPIELHQWCHPRDHHSNAIPVIFDNQRPCRCPARLSPPMV